MAFTILQTSVAPAVQQQTEARHYTIVRGDFQTLRNNLLTAASQGIRTSTVITLGSDYPSYLLLVQPPGPTGRLQTTRPRTISLSNVEATDPDVQDLLEAQGVDGDNTASTITIRPQGVAYTPSYHRFPTPTIRTWSTGVVIERLSAGSRRVTGQALISGRRLSLINVTGSIARGQTAPLTIQGAPASASPEAITLSEADQNAPVKLTVPTTMPESEALTFWSEALQGELEGDGDCKQPKPPNTEFVCGIGFIENNPDTVTDNRVVISLEYAPGKKSLRYRLSAALVGLKTRNQAGPTMTTTPRYLVTASADQPAVPEETKLLLTVEMRDRYHNPVGQRPVHAEVTSGGGTISTNTKLVDHRGQATFTYEAPKVSGNKPSETATVTVWLGSTSLSNPPARKEVTFVITVQNTG